MEYQVTCNECGKKFQITADSDSTINCTCPYCSHALSVVIPRAMIQGTAVPPIQQPINPQQPITSQQPTSSPTPQQPTSTNWTKVLLIVLIVLIVAGIGAFAFIQCNRQKEQNAQEELIRQQVHNDSIMRVRKGLENKAVVDAQTQQRQRAICTFIESFYRKAVLSGNTDGYEFYQRYLTDYCAKMVFGPGTNEGWEGWWDAFGNGTDEPNLKRLLNNLRVTHDQGDWYNVRLSQNGQTKFRKIKVKIEDGHTLIDDIK